MMMADLEHKEIFIVKRHAGDHDGHHGGAWKIALADFMTAMMALFLVLWLISSTSEKTKHTVAQYFNPVKLVEMSTLKKGFHDPKDTEMGTGSSPKEPEAESNSQDSKSSAPRTVDPKASAGSKATAESEAALFRDPYAVLAEIAASTPQRAAKKFARPQANIPPDDAEEAFADPFATAPQKLGEPSASASASPQGEESGSQQEEREQGPAAAKDEAAQSQAPGAANLQVDKKPRVEPASEKSGGFANDAAKIKADILRALKNETRAQSVPRIEVEETAEGVLVSLTDDAKFSMFAVGSAKPRPETVQVMEKVGQVLNSGSGSIVIRGHTDGRPYKSEIYDNWRLSAARAQIALYMLTRGGVSEKRIEKVEGYADHHLKTPDNPNGSENRRIEILLRKDKA
jgi:chemotaxis protein MotB